MFDHCFKKLIYMYYNIRFNGKYFGNLYNAIAI